MRRTVLILLVCSVLVNIVLLHRVQSRPDRSDEGDALRAGTATRSRRPPRIADVSAQPAPIVTQPPDACPDAITRLEEVRAEIERRSPLHERFARGAHAPATERWLHDLLAPMARAVDDSAELDVECRAERVCWIELVGAQSLAWTDALYDVPWFKGVLFDGSDVYAELAIDVNQPGSWDAEVAPRLVGQIRRSSDVRACLALAASTHNVPTLTVRIELRRSASGLDVAIDTSPLLVPFEHACVQGAIAQVIRGVYLPAAYLPAPFTFRFDARTNVFDMPD